MRTNYKRAIATMKYIAVLFIAFTINFCPAQQNVQSGANKAQLLENVHALIVKGKILDYHSGKAVPHLELQVTGTDMIKATDAYGRFKFILPDTLARKTLVLSITSKGQMLLDSAGSIIPQSSLRIDTVQQKNEIIIYRYPLGILPKVGVLAAKAKQMTKE